MDKERYARGDKVRREVLGSDYVDRANERMTDFMRPLADYATEICWGEVWSQPDLPRKTRSLLNVALLTVMNRPTELRTHLRGALRNGCTKEELRATLMQVAIYCGLPAAVEGFRAASEILAEQSV